MKCVLIIAMQLACTSNNNIACIDNESLAQLLYVPTCQEVLLNAKLSSSAGTYAATNDTSEVP
jgi:hypothetical protein